MTTKSLMKDPSPSRTAAPTAAAKAVLDVAEQLAQTRGYNGFSYADIAAQLGVTKASLHYHFASKADLGRALIERYRAVFDSALSAIDAQASDPRVKLRHYAALYESVLGNERMCLCGMLAAEYTTLPAPMQRGLTSFFDANERWLTTVLEGGLRAGVFQFSDSANERARVLLGALEGAMLVARSYGDPRRFHAAAEQVLADIGGGGGSAQRKSPRVSAARRARRAYDLAPQDQLQRRR
jgi:TetR/AcrR family transcriptional regulator, transcriptional repressor for nem operon